MIEIRLSKHSQKFLTSVHPRHAIQLRSKILSLKDNPYPQDSKQLINYDYFRVDAGEYRIVYKLTDNILFIVLIGKRNDDEIYKKLKRIS
jgi:mRNA interferase RelE/StbE